MLKNIYLLILFLSFLSSLRAFRLDLPRPFKYFSWFLLFVFFIELMAVVWPRIITFYYLDVSKENHWIYNIYIIPAYLFYLYFYYYFLRSSRVKKIIRITAIVFLFFGLLNLSFGQGLFIFNTYTVLIAGFLMIFLTLSYFYQVLYTKEVILLRRDPIFWISSGAFLFHLTSLLGLFFIVFLNNWYAKAAYATILIIKFASMAMYISYSIAFLCLKKK